VNEGGAEDEDGHWPYQKCLTATNGDQTSLNMMGIMGLRVDFTHSKCQIVGVQWVYQV
jgi:hypothetical protein